MTEHSIVCPICQIPLQSDSTICPDCGEDLAALVHLQRRSQVLYNKGLQLAQADDQERAILALQQALEADATNVAAMTVLGKLYALGERYAEARLIWERALEQTPEDPKLKAGLARLDQLEEAKAKAAAATAAKTAAATAAAKEAQAKAASATLRRNRLGATAVIVVLLILLLSQQLWLWLGINSEPERVVVVVTTTAFIPTSSPTIVPQPSLTEAPEASQAYVGATLVPTGSATPVVTLSATATATTAPTPTPTLTPTPIPTTTPPPDLRTPVETALLNQEGLLFLSLEVVQEGTIIHLIGEVPDLSSRYLAETTARTVAGVSMVNLQELTLAPTYTVQRGDGLLSISNQIYGSPDHWQQLARANNLAPPYLIVTGQKLMIPTP